MSRGVQMQEGQKIGTEIVPQGLAEFGLSGRDRLKRVGDHIGGRIRERRTELGLTQEQLGQELGVSYQQIQKYETASNRVSAGRLYELAQAFGVGVSYFYEGFDGSDENGALPHGGHNRAAIELVRNFLALSDGSLRIAVSGLLKALRAQQDDEDASGHDGAISS